MILKQNDINQILKGYIDAAIWTEEERLKDDYQSEYGDEEEYDDSEDDELEKLIKISANLNKKSFENFTREDIEPDSLIKAYTEIKKFLDLAGDSVIEAIETNGLERLGHDIWLTRNGHGAGFFDHSYDDENEKKLMQAANALKEVNIYINDNLRLSFDNEHIDEAKKTDYSKEKSQGLHGWFSRRGGDGSSGWVDCNTCRKDPETGRKKCKPCGRQDGEKRKYPACRPTPASCGTRGKGEKWGKKTNNESVEFQDEEITAYHGGPHSFDKFSTQHMGTGEGVQTFGWGLYFTDLEDIAINYANKLSDTSIKTLSIGLLDLVRNGRWVGYDVAKTETERRIVEHFAINEKEITDAYNEGKDLNKAVLLLLQDFINDEKQELKNASSPYSTRDNDVVYYTNSIKEAESLKKKIIKINIVSNRNLYAVSLHKGKTPNQYTWLEWDKALRDQSNATKTALEKHFSLESFDEDFATAGDFYKSRARKFDSQEKASKELLSLGIDGIKYPAESISRGTTSDTARGFNYVVFDENAINIEKQSQFENKNTMKDLITQKLHEMVEENHNELQNYMFFNNLKTLHDAIGELLEMNPQQVDQILSDGHNWALDHMATATDDIEEVYHFLNATMDGHEPDSYEGETEPGYSDDFGSVEVYRMNESEYKGKKVKLGKPMRGDVKKFKVFVKNKSGKVVKVNFGDKKMEIKRDNPKRRKSFRARHKCSQAKDRTTPKYWSCRMWSKKPVSKIV